MGFLWLKDKNWSRGSRAKITRCVVGLHPSRDSKYDKVDNRYVFKDGSRFSIIVLEEYLETP